MPTNAEGQAPGEPHLHGQLFDPVDRATLAGPAARGRDAGFDAIEFWWPFAISDSADAEVTAFIPAVQDAGVQLTGLNFAAGDMPGGDRGILSDTALTQAFRDNVDIAIGIAETLGTRAFNALYGNRIEDSTPTDQDHVASENLAYAALAADRIGATVLVEPVSGPPRYPLKTATDVIRVIDRVQADHGTTNLRLLADLYHLARNGDDTTPPFADYGDRIGHVQIADAPGRGEPGTGEVPLATQLEELRTRGYTGYIGLEYKPSRADTFDWLPRADRGMNGLNVETLRQQQKRGSREHHRFIGLGIMGGPMARQPGRRRTTPSIGYNRAAERSTLSSRPAARGRHHRRGRQGRRRRWRSWFPDSPDVQAVLLGEDGVFAHAAARRPGDRLLLASGPTSRPSWPPSAAERGLRISTHPFPAERPARSSATLVDHGRRHGEADFASAKPVLDVVGKTIAHVGPNGSGQTVKAANQLIVAGNIELLAEAIIFLQAYGVDIEAAVKVLGGGLAGSAVLDRRPQRCWPATSTPASASRLTTKTWASSRPRPERPASSSRSVRSSLS